MSITIAFRRESLEQLWVDELFDASMESATLASEFTPLEAQPALKRLGTRGRSGPTLDLGAWHGVKHLCPTHPPGTNVCVRVGAPPSLSSGALLLGGLLQPPSLGQLAAFPHAIH